ncbi:MAG: FadR family transcriptional regulator [Clostridiales bacterium]|nr:FadR family transcriptional regulator [Clostridiales bacterium]
MGLTAIKKESIGEQVLAQMKEQILNGDWKEGEKIPSENQLCDTFGVSRVTVRQAIQKLVALGLLETKLGEGSYVKGFDLQSFIKGVIPAEYLTANDLMDVMRFRIHFEPMVAAWAAASVTDEQIAEMEETLQNMIESQNDYERYVIYDNEFHRLLTHSTGNQIAIFISDVIKDVMTQTMKIMTEGFGPGHGITCHQQIIDALRERDVERARQTMFFHVDYNMKYYEETVLKRED